MTLSEAIKQYALHWSSPIFDPKCFTNAKIPFGIEPRHFLAFAEKDLLQSDTHGFVNALSNAKRAIDCQVDSIFRVFSLPPKRTFPSKLDELVEIGFVAPRVIKKVVRIRNLLEHEFRCPTHEEVEDAVDIATLFIEVTSRVFRTFMTEFLIADDASLNPKKHNWNSLIGFQFDLKAPKFIVDVVANGKTLEVITITSDDPAYKRIIRLSLECDFNFTDGDPNEIVKGFLAAF